MSILTIVTTKMVVVTSVIGPTPIMNPPDTGDGKNNPISPIANAFNQLPPNTITRRIPELIMSKANIITKVPIPSPIFVTFL